MAQTAAELIDLYTRAFAPIGNAGQGRLAIEQALAQHRQAEIVRAQQFAQQRALEQMQQERQQQFLQEQYRQLGLRDTVQFERQQEAIGEERTRIAAQNQRRSQNFIALTDQSNALTEKIRQTIELTDAEKSALAHQAAVEAQVANASVVSSIKSDWRNLSQIKNAEKAALASELFAAKQEEAQKLKVGQPAIQALLRQQQAFDARVKLFAQNPELLDAVDFTTPQASNTTAPAGGAGQTLESVLAGLDTVADQEAGVQAQAAAVPAYETAAIPEQLRNVFRQQDAAQTAQNQQRQLAATLAQINQVGGRIGQADARLQAISAAAMQPGPAPTASFYGDPWSGLGQPQPVAPQVLRSTAIDVARQRQELATQLAALDAQRRTMTAANPRSLADKPVMLPSPAAMQAPDSLIMQAQRVPQTLQNPAVAQILQAIAAQTRGVPFMDFGGLTRFAQ